MTKNLKKLFAILISLSLLLALASCAASPMAPGDGFYDGPMNNLSGTVNGNPSPEKGEDLGDAANPSEPGLDGTRPNVQENPFIATNEQSVSTLSADVDTASYAYFRKLISQSGLSFSRLQSYGASFRTEEFINYFRYGVTSPAENELFGVNASIVPCPWNASTVLMRMTLKANDATAPVGNNLVFLIDVSGSMNSSDKLPLLKQSFSYLTSQLTAEDRISIVTYSGSERVVLEGCPGNDTQTILNALNALSAYGSTNGEAGLTRAYEIAQANFIEGGNNRIIMASDGDLNVGISSADQLKSYVAEKRDAGIYLSVLGFGTGNYRDANMEALADNGNGVYYYIDGMSEAEKVFGSDLLSTLYTVAEDVKLQIHFDPQYVSSFRLIGYENRILNEEDFEDDTKDAGEVGAGHCVTVCYELTVSPSAMSTESAWMTLDVRYKEPGTEMSMPTETFPIGKAHYTETLDEDMLFVCSVIQTVMLLHNSTYAPDGLSIAGILETLNALDLSSHPDRAEFRDLLTRIRQ